MNTLRKVVLKANKRYGLGLSEDQISSVIASLRFAGYTTKDRISDIVEAISEITKGRSVNPLVSYKVEAPATVGICPLCGDSSNITNVVLADGRATSYCRLHRIVLPLPVNED